MSIQISGVWQLIDQEKIHKKCFSDVPKKREESVNDLRTNFSSLPDMQQAWNDLVKLTSDENIDVRENASYSLVHAFSLLPNKKKGWRDLRRLIFNNDSTVRHWAAVAIIISFPQVSHKRQAWDDLHKLTSHESSDVRYKVADILISLYSQVPNKQQAWKDLVKLAFDEESYVRDKAASDFISVFDKVPDKQQAWNDLVKLTFDENSYVRDKAADALVYEFFVMQSKQQAWNDLQRLTLDKYPNLRSSATRVLIRFSKLPDEQQAWNDLQRLTFDKDPNLRSSATRVLIRFSKLPDKQQAWNDLHRLINDENSGVRYGVACALESNFPCFPDKQQAWNDLIRLTFDEDYDVVGEAVCALGSVFIHVPDKQQAWNDLIKLISHENNDVRIEAAYSLVSACTQVPDKREAWGNLQKLTCDKDIKIRISANYSLGKVSILKASNSENEENYKIELENAIKFFETVALESSDAWSDGWSPSKFCLPFYRSFYTIIFKRDQAKEEVDKYLAEAKDAIKGSKSKELLLEAVNNLVNALKEVQNLENIDLQVMKGELNFYRKYCDRAAELMRDTEETAPFATATLRRGLPILDRNIKGLLEDIQNKAKIACQVSQSTPAQEIARAVNQEVKNWEIGSQEEMSWYVNNLVIVLKSKIPHGTENKEILDMIDHMRDERDLTKQYRTLSSVIGLIPTVNVVSEQVLDSKLQKFGLAYDEIVYIKEKLSCISFDISRIKLNSADFISDLKTMKEELEKLNKIEGLNTISIEKLDSIQAEKLNGLNKDILARLDEIKIIIDALPKNDDTQKILGLLSEVKQSDSDTLLQRSSAIVTLIGFIIPVLQKF